MVTKEIWKDIKGYEGRYQISSAGNVKSLKRHYVKKDKILKAQSDKDGYSVITLSKNNNRKTFSIHRLVALHFLNNPNDLLEVNHINTKRDDNRLENLEWIDSLGNKHHSNSYKIQQIDKNGNVIMQYPSVNITKKYGFVPQCIHRVLRGVVTQHKGYDWRYVDEK